MARKKKTPPRIVVKTTRTFVRIPQESKDIEQYSYYWASLHKYPISNPHWNYGQFCYVGDVALCLERITETHFDRKGRPIHEFCETKDGITESSWVYVDLTDGTTVAVQSNSDGTVYISHEEDHWNLKNGAFGWGMAEPIRPKEQEDFEAYEENMSFGDEREMTPEERKEFERRLAESSKEVVTSKDKYGNPMAEEYWYCGILESNSLIEYVYAHEEKNGK